MLEQNILFSTLIKLMNHAKEISLGTMIEKLILWKNNIYLGRC